MIKEIDDELYETVRGWWASHSSKYKKLLGLPKEILPNGYMAFDGDKPAIATWVYTHNTVAWYAWTTVNPEIRGKVRDDCFNELFTSVDKALKDLGILYVLAGANNASLLTRFINNGFMVDDYDNVHMSKQL